MLVLNPKGPKTSGLGSSLFARRYWGNLVWLLFLRLLRCFSSPGYLPFGWYDMTRTGLPHSEMYGSLPACGSPYLFAAYRVLHRLSMPRQPPYALCSLITCFPVNFPYNFVAPQFPRSTYPISTPPSVASSRLVLRKISAEIIRSLAASKSAITILFWRKSPRQSLVLRLRLEAESSYHLQIIQWLCFGFYLKKYS